MGIGQNILREAQEENSNNLALIKLKEFAVAQRKKSLEFYEKTKLNTFAGEVVAFELTIEEIDKILNINTKYGEEK